jgi:BlaR1 peptidase M56
MMAPGLLPHLQDASLRSLLPAILGAVVLWTIRHRRSAAAHHAVWSAVLAGMLLLFWVGPFLPALPLRILPEVSPRSELLAPAWRDTAVVLYGAVALVFGLRLLTGCWLVRRLVRASKTIDAARRLYESAAIVVPLTAGWIRPKILLPPGWQGWDQQKLEAVLAHEDHHVRRRDALVTLLAAVNRSIFWFHPLAWWMERKLALLAEQACDDACLRRLGDRDRYAHLLIEMAGAVEAARGRVLRHALSMAKPSHMKRRIESILDAHSRPEWKLTQTGCAALLACSMAVIYGTAAIRLEPQPPVPAIPFRAFAPPPPVAAVAAHVPQLAVQPRRRNGAEYELAALVQRQSDPPRKLELLNLWKTKYPHSEIELTRLQLYLNTYSELNDVPNLLTALNQMGKEAAAKALQINPGRAEADFSPVAKSQALFYYARAATYEGPGSLPAEGRQQLDEYLRQTYRSYYGRNEIGLNELKNLAKSMPFPPQAFLISVLPPPNRTFDSSLAAATSSLHIRNQCPYGLRIDCSGPERKRTWIPSGGDSQLVIAPGTYEIYAADVNGVSSFTGPGRFDPQFDYAYTLSVRQPSGRVPLTQE